MIVATPELKTVGRDFGLPSRLDLISSQEVEVLNKALGEAFTREL